MRQTLRWVTWRPSATSRLGTPASGTSCLIATTWPDILSSPLYTVLHAPCPIFSCRTYWDILSFADYRQRIEESRGFSDPAKPATFNHYVAPLSAGVLPASC